MRTSEEVADIKARWAESREVARLQAKSSAELRHEARTAAQIADIRERAEQRQERLANERKAGYVLKQLGAFSEVDASELRSLLAQPIKNATLIPGATKRLAQQMLYERKAEKLLSDFIPDVRKWHKQFSLDELAAVRKAVQTKMAGWKGLSDTNLMNKLVFEIKWVEDTKKYSTWQVAQAAYQKQRTILDYKINTAHITPKLTEVQQWVANNKPSALLARLLADAEKAYGKMIPVNQLQAKLDTLTKLKGVEEGLMEKLPKAKAWLATHKNANTIADLVMKLEEGMAHGKSATEISDAYDALNKQLASSYKISLAFAKKRLAGFENTAEQIQSEIDLRQSDLLRTSSPSIAKKLKQEIRVLKTQLKHIQKVEDEIAELESLLGVRSAGRSGTPFGPEAYSQERKKAARLCATGIEADNELLPNAQECWNNLWTLEEKYVAHLYTDGSSYMNEPTYTTYYGTKYGRNRERRDSWTDINTLTQAIDKAPPLNKDMYFMRGEGMGAFIGQFGVNLLLLSDQQLQELIGKEGVNYPFTSCGCTEFAKFSRTVTLRAYCPKGTKGIYVEPFSSFENSRYFWGGLDWDGRSRIAAGHTIGAEQEFLIQRGTRYRITGVQRLSSGGFLVDVDVIEQPKKYPNQP